MNRITSLTLKDVRCFEGEHTGKTPRVTLLVGENSTGKSSFLGCYQAFARVANFVDDGRHGRNRFDEAPFHMGSFESIARFSANEFVIEGELGCHC